MSDPLPHLALTIQKAIGKANRAVENLIAKAAAAGKIAWNASRWETMGCTSKCGRFACVWSPLYKKWYGVVDGE